MKATRCPAGGRGTSSLSRNRQRWRPAGEAERLRGSGGAEDNQKKGYKMKSFKTGLLQGRITRRSLLAAVLPAAGASLALAGGKDDHPDDPRRCFRLGGSFIGRDATGDLLNLVQIPLDPEGKTAATHVMLPEYPLYVAGLLASYGADSLTNYVGEAKMTSFDTAKQTALGYAVASGNPPVIKVIHHVSGTMRFLDADTIMYSYISTMYLASADGFPSGNPVLGPLPPVQTLFKRVAVM